MSRISENVGASNSSNIKGLHRPVQRKLYLYYGQKEFLVYTVLIHSSIDSIVGNYYYYFIVTDPGFDLGSATPPDSHLLASDVDPDFNEPIKNITVPVGREAVLSCLVTELGQYKVGSMIYSHMPSVSVLVSCGDFPYSKLVHSYAMYG
jgi:hypothetical protein